VHEIRTYAAEDIRFGMRYTDALTIAEDGTPVMDLTRIGELEPDIGDRQEPGWNGAGKRGIEFMARPRAGSGGFVLKTCARPKVSRPAPIGVL
jgi:hypothetical protein